MPTPAIFISHSHFDNDQCRKLVQFLKDRIGPGANIFFDESELHGGDDWFRRIQHEVIARPIFLVVLSRHSVVAEWVAEETNLALTKSVKDKSRKVIPVQIDPALTLEAIEQFAPILTLRQITHLEVGAPQANWEDLAAVVLGQRLSLPPPPPDPEEAARRADLEQARDLVAQVHEELSQGHARIAVKLGRDAVGLPGNERDATLWGDFGLALIQMGETTEGLKALDTALGFNRSRPDLLRAKARLLCQQQQYAPALQAWDKAFVATGATPDRLAILAEAYDALVRVQQWPLAGNVVADALDLAPRDAAWLQRQQQMQLVPLQSRWQTASAAGKWTEALAIVDEALRLAPNDATWQQLRTQAQTEIQRAQQAVAEQQRQAEIARQRQAAAEEQARLAKLLPTSLQKLTPPFILKRFGTTDLIIPPVSALIPAGPFTMGGDKDSYQGTQRVSLNLGAFQIGLYQVTVAEYACAVAAKAVAVPQDNSTITWAQQQQRLDHPVVNVTWLQARDYTRWLAEKTGQPWRLPTEAEWERAARGTDGRIYPWGNTFDKAKANMADGSQGTTTPVGYYADKGDASPVGAHDMAGNVWEWTSSIWQERYNVVKCENKSDETSVRVLRGGSWWDDPLYARAASRVRVRPNVWSSDWGWRLALGAGGAGS